MGHTQVLGVGDYENLRNYFQQAILLAQSSIGFERSNILTDSIANGQTVGAIKDFLVPYGFLTVRITDCTRVQANTVLRIDVGMTDSDTLCRLKDINLNSADLVTIPNGAGNTLQVVLPQAMGFRRVRTTLSLAASGGAVPIEYYAADLMRA